MLPEDVPIPGPKCTLRDCSKMGPTSVSWIDRKWMFLVSDDLAVGKESRTFDDAGKMMPSTTEMVKNDNEKNRRQLSHPPAALIEREDRQEGQGTKLMDLDDDILHLVLSRLDNEFNPHAWPADANALLKCATVCKRWRSIVDSVVSHIYIDMMRTHGPRRILTHGLMDDQRWRFPDLRSIALRGCQLASLQLFLQRDYRHLSCLVLSNMAEPMGSTDLYLLQQRLPMLETLFLDGALACDVTEMTEEVFAGMGCLRWLSLASSASLTKIECPKLIAKLELRALPRVTSLSSTFSGLSALESLHISCMPGIRAFPTSLGNLPRLRQLHVEELQHLTLLPDTLDNLTALQDLSIARCPSLVALPHSIGHLHSLRSLSLVDCKLLFSLPGSLCSLPCLERLHLLGCDALGALPHSMGQLRRCLQELKACHCTRLRALPASLTDLVMLRVLDLSYCNNLVALPQDMGKLSSLQSLSLRGCSQLLSLPNSFTQVPPEAAENWHRQN